jgi:hypothetical protein
MKDYAFFKCGSKTVGEKCVLLHRNEHDVSEVAIECDSNAIM